MADYDFRNDGTKKGLGFFGELERPDGDVSTEISVGVNLDGREVEIPALVPGLNRGEIDHLLANGRPTPAILDKAVAHAQRRIAAGQSPFAGVGEQKYLAPNRSNTMYDDDEFLISDSMTAPPPADLFVSPESRATGIGLDTQAPAPVVDRPVTPMSEREKFLGGLSPMQRVGLGFLNFSRGARGQMPYEYEVEERAHKDRLRKLQEFKVLTDSLDDGVKMAQRLQGTARVDFVEQYAKQLESVRPGLGETYRTLSKQPDMGTVLSAHADKSPTLQRALKMDPSGAAALKLISSPEALKTINAEIDSSLLPALTRKAQTFKMGWQQLVPPEMAERFNKDGRITASELMEANDWIKANKPDMKALSFTDEDIQVINRNAEAFYGSVGILSPKDEAEVTKDRLKRPAESEIGKIRADIASGAIGKAEGEAKIRKLTKEGGDGDTRMTPATISVNGKNVAALVDKAGNYYDANTRQRIAGGIGPQITEADERRGRELAGRADAVTSLEKDVSALEKIVKNHPRSAAGLFAAPAGAIEYVAGSLNPGGKGASPATTAVQLRDSILQRTASLSRMSNEDRKRMENALQVGPGGNPRNLPLAIQIIRDGIAKEKAQLDSPRPRGKGEGGKKNPAEMTDDELIKALGGG